MRIINWSLTLAILLWVAGCASSSLVMDTAVKKQVTGTNTVLGIRQTQIGGMASPPYIFASLIQFSFDVAMVVESIEDLHNRQQLEKDIKPLRQVLSNFDFDGLALSDFRGQLAQVDWLRAGNTVLTKDVTHTSYDRLLGESQAPYTLFVTLGYALVSDCTQLEVTAHLALIPKSALSRTKRIDAYGEPYFVAASDEVNAVYTTSVTYLTAMPEGVDDQLKTQMDVVLAQTPMPESPTPVARPTTSYEQARIRYWAQDDGAVAKARLSDATSDLSWMVMYQLQHADEPVIISGYYVSFGTCAGNVVKTEEDGRSIVRCRNGSSCLSSRGS